MELRPAVLAGIEGRLPSEIAAKAEADGVAKVGQDGVTLLTLGVLGGSFIAFGAIFSNVALTGAEGVLPFGMARVTAGLVFAVGLGLVLIAGAQIFTGDVLMVMAWASRRLAARRVLRVWVLVWIGNLAGALGAALLVLLAGHHLFGGGQIGLTALRTAEAKSALPFGQALILGVLCNTLVCLAVWLSLSSRQPVHRLMVVILPIAAFVAAGFEHAVANMYFLGFGLMIKSWASDGFWQVVRLVPSDFPSITVVGFAHNLLAVTVGNIAGGAVLVAGVYWVLYRRLPQGAVAAQETRHGGVDPVHGGWTTSGVSSSEGRGGG